MKKIIIFALLLLPVMLSAQVNFSPIKAKSLISSNGSWSYNGTTGFNFALECYFTDGSYTSGTLSVNVTVTYYQIHLGQKQVTFDMLIYYYDDFGSMRYWGEQEDIVGGSTASYGGYTINSITPID